VKFRILSVAKSTIRKKENRHKSRKIAAKSLKITKSLYTFQVGSQICTRQLNFFVPYHVNIQKLAKLDFGMIITTSAISQN
jgi:hypothetical protein